MCLAYTFMPDFAYFMVKNNHKRGKDIGSYNDMNRKKKG